MSAGGVREIQLTKGFVAVVDAEDFEWLSQWKWRAVFNSDGSSGPYAYRNARVDGKRRGVWMHREILAPAAGLLPDHINGNGLDNRRENLRAATYAQNSRNAKTRKDNRIGLRGVRLYKGRWVARITVACETIYLGCFDTASIAASAYDAAALIHHGEFARLNFPEAQHG